MSCLTIDDQFRCPTKMELWRQILDLGPHGRAWQTHQAPEADGADFTPLTAQQRYWAAYAEVLAYLHQRACDLLEEFFCATAKEQLAEWQKDWGFPDRCEHYRTLCEKVADDAGQRCDDLVAIAAAAGWSIQCANCVIDLNAGDLAIADIATASCKCNAITIIVSLAGSSAYHAPTNYAFGDLAVADGTSICPPGLEGLQCLIEKVRPAHVPAIYEAV